MTSCHDTTPDRNIVAISVMVASFVSSISESFFVDIRCLDSLVLPRCIHVQQFPNVARTHLTMSLGMLDTLRQCGNVS